MYVIVEKYVDIVILSIINRSHFSSERLIDDISITTERTTSARGVWTASNERQHASTSLFARKSHAQNARPTLANLSTHTSDMSAHIYIVRECLTLSLVFYTNIDQKLVNSIHGILTCEICWLECRIREHVFIVYTCNTYSTIRWSM